MDAAERALLASTVRDALARADGPAAVDAALADFGWLEMLPAEPHAAVAIVFTVLGRTNGTATALDDVISMALGVTPRPDLAVVLPPFGTWHPPGWLDADRCRVFGIATGRAATAAELPVVGAAGRDGCAVTVPRAAAEVRPVAGVDPDAGVHVVRAEPAVTVDDRFDLSRWDAAVAAGRRAVGRQLAGACRAMLDLACAHATERVQFGRPIAGFQAVRHRLADVLVAVEALEATLDAADDAPGDLTAALAKATAGRTARTAATHCQQVLAGIGFTTDHPFHRFLQRSMVLEGLFGTADEIALDVGRHLLTTRRVPTLIDL